MKERIKSILFVFALALVFVGAAKVTEAAAAVKYDVVFEEETIVVEAISGSTYYQVVKDEAGKGLKNTSWIAAAKNEGNAEYPFIIDISALANTKDAYIAVAGDAKAESAAEVIKVPALVKGIKASLNYKVETVSAGLYQVISEVKVTPSEGAAVDVKTNISESLQLGWKRGANGDWKDADDFTTVEWQMMKNSNSTLYLRAEKLNGEETRFSKEVKVKIPKTAKAPNVKVDFKKGTVAIKNGMEFRVPGGQWITVAPKAKKGAEGAVDAFFNVAATNTAKAALTMAELKGILGTAYQDGKALTLEVRTSATEKKFMSHVNTITIAATPVAKEVVEADLTGAIVVSGTKVSIDLSALAEEVGEGYEFAFAGDGADVAAISKYTKLEEKVYEFKTTAKLSYKKTDKSSSKIGYDAITKVYLRKAAPVENGKQSGFAGEVAEIAIGKKAN